MIASNSLDDLFVLRELWLSLFGTTGKTVFKTDCCSLHDHVVHRKQVTEKRLTVDLATIAESLSLQDLSRFEWVTTNHQLADVLTKHTTAVQLLMSLDSRQIV